jgi:hypothetical protein
MSIRRYCFAIILSAAALFAAMAGATHLHPDNQFYLDCSICLQDTNHLHSEQTDIVKSVSFSPLQITLKPRLSVTQSSYKFSNPRAPPAIS